jgi:DNA-binding CsgD family transcriptional regulator/tetratricopeptide (TPR) repeat protein
MAVSVTCSRLVGRARELAELEAALADALDGRPSLAFVAGESGVGKTRLVSELRDRAAEQGTRVLSGDCVELGDGQLAYAPLVTAMRPLVRDHDPALEDLPAPVKAELAALLPGLGERVPRDRRDDQARVFEALLAVLDALSREAPVLLVIEDLHWSDASTRAFMRFLAAALADERILVVATYRPDELHRRHPLRPLLAELERSQRALRVELPRLARAELAEQLGDLLGEAPAADLVDRFYARSEGNPLYTEELLAAGPDGRGSLPASLAAALAVRIDRLEADAQEVVRVLSVAGGAEHEVLAAVAGLDPRVLNEALREAISSHIVRTGAGDRYMFRHALLREAVYDELLPGERAELHRALAAALELPASGGAPATAQRAARIAHHYLSAGDQPAALAAAVRAGIAAMDVQAHEEGAELFDRALELWSRVPDAEAVVGEDEAALLDRAALCRLRSDDVPRAEALARRALEKVDEEEEPRRSASLLGLLSRAQWALMRQDEAAETLQRALALLEHDGPSPERAGLLAYRAKRLMVQSKYRAAVGAARTALRELAGLPGDACRSDQAAALNALGVSLIALGHVDEGTVALERALGMAREEGDHQDLTVAFANLADALGMAGRTADALAVARQGYAELPGVRARRWLSLAVSQFSFDAGVWEEAEAAVAEVDRRGEQTGNTELERRLRHAELALGRDEREAAREHLRVAGELGADSREPQYLGVLGDLLAQLRLRDDDIAAARAAVDEALDRIEFCSEDLLRIIRVSATGLAVESAAAQRARDLGEPAAQAAALERAEALIQRTRAAAEDGQALERAYAATAEAEHARALAHDDPALWAAAAEAWEALERPYPALQARWHEAEALVAGGDREAAAPIAVAALAGAERLGATWLAAELESLAARARLRLSGSNGAGRDDAATARDEDDDPFGLTPRERQVLALVAAGATNREIGRQLYMAEKTASVHVSRILVKLDVRSRTEAAGVAHRLGLDVAA